MNYEKISALVGAESYNIVYLSDPETYELLYLNPEALQVLGNPAEEEWLRQPCYRLLQRREAPCSFCTNAFLSFDRFYTWEHYNAMLGRYYSNKDKLVELDGRAVRLEISVDITEREEAMQKLRQKLEMEQTLLSCIQTLTQARDVKSAINRLLEIVGRYYGADRAHIFEFDEKRQLVSNTYEWSREGVQAQILHLQELPMRLVDRWVEEFRSKGEFYIASVEEDLEKDSQEYRILASQNIQSVMAAPLEVERRIIGFIGVDSPRANVWEMTLLRSIAHFIIDDFEKRRLLEELTRLSYTDALTGLGNRRRYMQRLQALEASPPASLGVVYVDVNSLKAANDIYGHQRGDHMLRQAAGLLTLVFGKDLFRIGGDEFVALCPGGGREEFEKRVARLRELAKRSGEVSLSIGVSWSEGAEMDVQRQITHTDDLMYADKQLYYGTRRQSWTGPRPGPAQELLREIREGRFFVWLQPKVDLRTGGLRGAEALVRRLDSGCVTAPGKFVPLYEAEGIIRHVDFFVLRFVCRLLREWEDGGFPPVQVAVNFSRCTMMEQGLADQMAAVCEEYEVPPSRIKVEITESLGKLEEGELREIIRSVSAEGFQVSLDDFGTRYSNLSLLGSMEFSEVKLDKSLVDQLEANPKLCVIASHAVQMCRELGRMTSVAEGIETPGQLSLLREMNCEVGQGYYFDRPMPAGDFAAKYLGH